MTTLNRIFRTDPTRPRALCAGWCPTCSMRGRCSACATNTKRKRRELSPTEATWLVIVADVAVLLLLAALVRGVIS